MEIAICTRCQSNNPVFTKFCLTCGLAITSDMRRSIVASSSVAAKMAPASAASNSIASVSAKQNLAATAPLPTAETQTEQANNQPQTKGGGWLKSLFSK
ncbi:MAG: hypothetical protein HY819_00985 [Acidobacteria bacterium]|nr:hypothetical protein [Acidobacteriota bacterium]